MLELVTAGGWLMILILLCSVVAVAICFERIYTLNPKKIAPPHLLATVWKQLKAGELDATRLRELKSSSLISRTLQACRVVNSVGIQQPLSVIAASMGAYTAVKLLEYYQIKNMILLVPAMYDSKAYNVPFNEGFTEIIRRPESWDDSDAWQILSKYKGRLFIIAAENDNVIPKGVVNRIYDSAVNAEERELFFAPRASHAVFTDLRSNNPDVFCSVFGQIVTMLKKT